MTRHFKNWIAGLASRKPCAAPHALERSKAAALVPYNAESEELADRYQVSRLRGENDRDLAFRTSVEIAGRLVRIEAGLDRVITFNKVDRS